MKFSLAATCALLLSSSFVGFTRADSYSDAMAAWCGDLSVTSPTTSDVYTTGQNATVTVTRNPDDQHQKTITGLDLYSVDSSGQAKYISNVWSGEFPFNDGSTASLSDAIPSSVSAGSYYYRVWVTNMLGDTHGPDCLETSGVFKVTVGSHVNEHGNTVYHNDLEDPSVYNPEHLKGCFGLTFDLDGTTFKAGDHIRLQLTSDSAAVKQVLQSINLYKKSSDGQSDDQKIDTIWSGSERLANVYSLKDHLVLPQEQVDANAEYYYEAEVSAGSSQSACSFVSTTFKISS